MRRTGYTIRHRLAMRALLVAVLAMLMHMAVPHHHHARYVALVCLHDHHAALVDDAPHCLAGGAGCQAEDAADCQPCDALGQGLLRPAQRHLLPGQVLPGQLLPSHLFLLPGRLCCPLPAMSGCGHGDRQCACRQFLPGSAHGFTFGLRAPPQGC